MIFSLVGRASLRSPRLIASMACVVLPVPATVQQPVLNSALPALGLTVNENHAKSSLLSLVAAAGVFGMLFHSYEPSSCMGKRKKKGSDQVDDLYEVDHIKARKLEKGVPKYLIHWKNYADKDDTWEGLDNLAGFEPDIATFEAAQKEANDEFAAAMAKKKTDKEDKQKPQVLVPGSRLVVQVWANFILVGNWMLQVLS